MRSVACKDAEREGKLRKRENEEVKCFDKENKGGKKRKPGGRES